MMTVVLGFTEFLLKDPALSPGSRRDVAEIQKAADRASGITQQVLAFSRRQILLAETLDLAAVVGETERMLRRLLDERITIAMELPAGLPPVRADRHQLEQVVVNLALNARDAMPGGGRLVLAARAADLGGAALRAPAGIAVVPGPYVLLEVRDTGTGMAPEVRRRAFEPFFTTKTVGEGTGLGLATVFGIIKQSHGYVWIDSEPGRGTTVVIALPAAPVERAAAPAAPGPTGAPDAAEAPEASGEVVLVVEDEIMVRTMTRRTLESLGYRVLEAEEGEAALRVFEREGDRVGLVLTDVVMPRLDGRALGDRLAERRPSLPVVYMSAHPSEEMLRRGLLRPGQRFLQKPFRIEALAECVRAAFRSRVPVPG
jgi:CheY-like chemotaxis protein